MFTNIDSCVKIIRFFCNCKAEKTCQAASVRANNNIIEFKSVSTDVSEK